MKKTLYLLALSLTLLLGLTLPARADLIYTWTTTTAATGFTDLVGSFTVPDAAISDGVIVDSEITSYTFSDSLAVFAPPSDFINVNIPVDPVTGAMLPGGFTAFVEDGFNQTLQQNTGPGTELYSRVQDSPFQAGVGDGTWSVSSTSAVPEPASVMLVLAGIAGLAGYGWRRRKRSVATAAGGSFVD